MLIKINSVLARTWEAVQERSHSCHSSLGDCSLEGPSFWNLPNLESPLMPLRKWVMAGSHPGYMEAPPIHLVPLAHRFGITLT